MEGSGVLSNGVVDILPHVNAGIVGVGHVKVDVDGGRVEAGGVPFYVKILSGGNILVHGWRFVEATSFAGWKLAVRWRFGGEQRATGLTRVGSPFPVDMADSEVG